MRILVEAGPRWVIGAFLFTVLLFPAPPGWAGALVTDSRGRVEGGDGSKPALLAELMPGDSLRLGRGARVTLLLLANGEEYTLKGPGKFLLSEHAVAALEGDQPVKRVLAPPRSALVQLRASEGAQATLVLRGADAGPRLLSPVDTAVIGGRPLFQWEPVDAAASYRFAIADQGGETLFETETGATSLRLAAAVRLREGASYSWTVEALPRAKRKREASGEFAVVDAATRAALERLQPRRDSPFNDRVAYALLLEQHNVRDAALAEWRRLAAERPGEPNLQERAAR